MPRVLQQLVAEGRVEQRTGEEDGRVRHLHLTAKGRRLTRNIEEQSLRRFSEVLERIPADERASMLRAIERFRAALEDRASEDAS